jgi:uncharacterized protein (DUF1501 family)
MSAGASRREIVQAGAAAAAVTPFLGSSAAFAAKPTMEADSYAPIVTIFDHRGCTRGTSLLGLAVYIVFNNVGH